MKLLGGFAFAASCLTFGVVHARVVMMIPLTLEEGRVDDVSVIRKSVIMEERAQLSTGN